MRYWDLDKVGLGKRDLFNFPFHPQLRAFFFSVLTPEVINL